MTQSGHRSTSLECDERHNSRSKTVIFLFKIRARSHAVLKFIRPLSTAVACTLMSAAFGEVFGFLCGGTLEDDAM
jgi:hypothetical protein